MAGDTSRKSYDLLTAREQEVLRLLREGMTNPQIAGHLGISLDGAKYHVSEIIGKLGVADRHEAAVWQPGRRPWWNAALAPLAFLWRRPRVSWLSPAIVAGAGLVVAVGVGLLVWGLLRTADDGDGSSNELTTSRGALSTPTGAQPTAALPPLPTPQPYVAEPVDCPGGHSTPEQAIEACRAVLFQGPAGTFHYEGDCDRVASRTFDEGSECSTWADGASSPRAYRIDIFCADCFDWLILEETEAGWIASGQALCLVQHVADIQSMLQSRGVELSRVRSDDCLYAPPPLARPTLRVGQAQTERVGNGNIQLAIPGGTFSGKVLYPGRGFMLELSITNVSGRDLPWTALRPEDVQLVANDDAAVFASEVGGWLAESVSDGFPADAGWRGWLVFPVEEFGTYTLRYPGLPDLPLELTPQDTSVPLER